MKAKVFVVLLCFALLLGGCTNGEGGTPGGQSAAPDGVSQATQSRYRENEIQEYNGARLDPAIGPRDNSISGVQHVPITSYKLTVDGAVNQTAVLSYDDVMALDAYQRKITLHCVEGWDATVLWEGALIEDLLDVAGIRADANTVIFHCFDGYTTSLPLSFVLDNQLIMAYNANGLPLPDEMGYPLIVVAEDKLGYKWARWVTRIELSTNENYLGFWERNGYSNDADVPENRK